MIRTGRMRRTRDQRGSAVVDFVLVLVLLLPLVLGILQLALVLHVRNTLASAAAEGARAAAVLGAPPGAGQQTAREQVLGAVSGRYARDITVAHTSVGGAAAYRVTIEATVPTLGIGGPGLTFAVSGNAVAEQLPDGQP